MANPAIPIHGETIESAWGADVVSRLVPVYADATARDAALPAPENGQLAAVTSPPTLTLYITGVWRDIGGAGIDLVYPNGVVTGRFSANNVAGFEVHGTDGKPITRLRREVGTDETWFDLYRPHISGGVENMRADAWGGDPPHYSISVTSSAARYKTNIRDWDDPAAFDHLRPVLYDHSDGGSYLGFVAEEVARIDHAGDYDADGTIRDYDHRAVIAALVSKMRSLEARLAALEGAT